MFLDLTGICFHDKVSFLALNKPLELVINKIKTLDNYIWHGLVFTKFKFYYLR